MVVIPHKNRYLRENVHSHEISKGLKNKNEPRWWKSPTKGHIIYREGQDPHIDNIDPMNSQRKDGQPKVSLEQISIHKG